MPSVQAQYTKELRQAFGYLATWLPGLPMHLGDVGVLQDGEFQRVTHLEPLGVAYERRKDNARDDLRYESSGKVSVTVKGAGEAGGGVFEHVGDAEAGIAVKFEDEKAVVLSLEGVRSDTISDPAAIERAAREQHAEAWDADWLVVSEIVTATKATILISNERNSSIELKAKVDVGRPVKLADAEAKLEVASSRGMHTQLIGASGLTPMFRAIQIRFGKSFWTGEPRTGFEQHP